MDGLYGTQMVHRWYIDGMNKLYHTQIATKKNIKNFVPYIDGMQMVWTVCMVHRWYIDGMN